MHAGTNAGATSHQRRQLVTASGQYGETRTCGEPPACAILRSIAEMVLIVLWRA
jgi:hypothetical protein